MEEDIRPVTREQYAEMLVEASFREAAEMEEGLLAWSEKHAPIWRAEGYDEAWIRQRISMAQSTCSLHRTLKQQGRTLPEIREELRTMYENAPELYDLAIARERLHPGLLRYRGNTSDLRLRYTLRVLLYEADKLAYEQLRRLRGLPVPDPEKAFVEPENRRVIRDLSNVEELELLLAMSRSMLHLFTTSAQCTDDELASLIKAEGERLRANFIAQHGYPPEESATPYIPVTIDGPQDHEEYYAKEYPDS
jgi:hypothetical protein